MTKSAKRGKRISKPEAEVLGVSRHGVWVFASGEEFFLSYKDYPWFREASVADVLEMIATPAGNLHWPALDVDLEIESLRHPEKYPLTYR